MEYEILPNLGLKLMHDDGRTLELTSDDVFDWCPKADLYLDSEGWEYRFLDDEALEQCLNDHAL